MNLEPSIAQVTLASKGIDGGRIIHANLAFLSIIAHAHSNMVVAAEAMKRVNLLRRYKP